MIETEDQLEYSKQQLEMLNNILRTYPLTNEPDVIQKARKSQLEGLILEISNEIDEYENGSKRNDS